MSSNGTLYRMPDFMQPRSLLETALFVISNSIGNLEISCPEVDEEEYDDAINTEELQDVVKYIHQLTDYYDLNVPRDLHDQLTFYSLLRLSMNCADPQGESCTCSSATVRTAYVCVRSGIEKIDLLKWVSSAVRFALIRSLRRLKYLKHLNLGTDILSEDDLKFVVSGFQAMEHLVSFTYIHCTDKFMKTISHYCNKTLENLDIRDSLDVTDSSVKAILNLSKLKTLNISSTNISVASCKFLIKNLPNLKFIASEKLNLVFPGFVGLPFKSVTFLCSNTGDITNLTKACPNIADLCVYKQSQSEHVDFSDLATLHKLSSLSISCCSFYSNNVVKVLQIRGHQLRHLHLKSIGETSLKTLTVIGSLCPSLKSLQMYGVRVICSERHLLTRTKLFPQLEDLKFTADRQPNQCLIFFLLNCSKLKMLHFFDIRGTTDAQIMNACVVNPLVHLEELVFWQNSLTVKSVKALLSSCKRLRRLGDFCYWKVSPKELSDLRAFVKEKNWDVDLFTSAEPAKTFTWPAML